MSENKKSLQEDVKNFIIKELEKRRRIKEQEEITRFMIKELEEKQKIVAKVDDTQYEVKKYFSVGEEIFNSIVHGIGALLSIAALVLLTLKADTPKAVVGVTIFASSAILLYTMSCLYHALARGKAKNVFERFDHLSIFILIAGTYTPFCLLVINENNLGWIIFFVQWSLALLGIIFKSIWINKFVILSVIIYLLMGWAIVISFNQLLPLGTPAIVMLVAGGLSYSIGTIFYIFSLFKFHHAIWHLFVLAGTILHFLCIYLYVI